MCVSVHERRTNYGEESLPVSYTAASLGEEWPPRVLELCFSPPAVENDSHCRMTVL